MPRRISPVVPLLTSTFFILSWMYVQLCRPPLFYFETIKGKIVKHKTEYNKKVGNDMLILWLNDTINQPYFSYYIKPNKAIIEYLNKNNSPSIKIWISNEREIKQLEVNSTKIVDYKWFEPIFLPFLALGLYYYFSTYKITKNIMTNVKSHKDMWEYVIGRRVLISKETNKPFKEEPPNWFGLFNSKNNKKGTH